MVTGFSGFRHDSGGIGLLGFNGRVKHRGIHIDTRAHKHIHIAGVLSFWAFTCCFSLSFSHSVLFWASVSFLLSWMYSGSRRRIYGFDIRFLRYLVVGLFDLVFSSPSRIAEVGGWGR